MLRSLKDLERYKVSATDGELGRVVNVLLDDERWVVRYLVVDTGGYLDDRRVLISPMSFRQIEWATQRFHLALTMDQVRRSPSVDVDQPVTWQHEESLHEHYGYPPHCGCSETASLATPASEPVTRTRSELPCPTANGHSADVHLRSSKELRGYQIHGTDGAIGHVDDFITDDVTWEVRYLVVDTGNWWVGKKVLVAPHWARHISWRDRTVDVDMSRGAIKKSPDWSATDAVNRANEERLYDYYGRPVYWTSGDRANAAQLEAHPGVHLG
jgi:hypothetical protein